MKLLTRQPKKQLNATECKPNLPFSVTWDDSGNTYSSKPRRKIPYSRKHRFFLLLLDKIRIFSHLHYQAPALRYSLWGTGFSTGVVFWATQLQWPSGSFQTDRPDVATPGGMELLLDCQHTLQLHCPPSIVSSKFPPVLRHAVEFE